MYLNVFRCNLTIELGFVYLGRGWWSRLDLRRFGLICIDSVGFDLGIFYMIATIWQVGVGSDRFRNIW